MTDSLGDRMKEYERVPRHSLMRRTPVLVRVDGKAFHTLTSWMNKPHDARFVAAMRAVAYNLALDVPGCRLAYVQSDEVSLLVTDWTNYDTAAWFNYDHQKVVSVAASMATNYFAHAYHHEFGRPCSAFFDARAWNVPRHEVSNYFIWRQQDATRNSLQGLARAHYSHAELHEKNSADLHEMLHARGVNWADLPTNLKHGSCVVREPLDFGPLQPDNPAPRFTWREDLAPPVFTQDRDYVERSMDPLP